MLTQDLHFDLTRIAEFCRKWQVSELALFGSALRDDFRPDSDVDLLVSFLPDAHRTYFDLHDMRQELESMIGRPTDLVSRRAVERSPNEIRRASILSCLEVLYAA